MLLWPSIERLSEAGAAVPDVVCVKLEQQGACALYPLLGQLQGFCSALGLAIPCWTRHAP